MKNIKHQILKIKKEIATSASYGIGGVLAMTFFLIVTLVFPKSAFAISPPFPTTNWLHQETSSVIGTNSWQMPGSDMDQAENLSTGNKVVNSTTEWQFYPGVTQSGGNGGISNGYGWIYDSPLNGQYDAGTWTFYVRMHSTNTAVTGVVRAYVKRYDGGSTYTDLFMATSGSFTTSSSYTTYSFTASPGAVDMQGEYLYVHYTWQSSSGGEKGGTPTYLYFHAEGNALSAANKPRIVPPGSSIDALGYSLIAISTAFFIAVLVKKRILHVKRVQVA